MRENRPVFVWSSNRKRTKSRRPFQPKRTNSIWAAANRRGRRRILYKIWLYDFDGFYSIRVNSCKRSKTYANHSFWLIHCHPCSWQWALTLSELEFIIIRTPYPCQRTAIIMYSSYSIGEKFPFLFNEHSFIHMKHKIQKLCHFLCFVSQRKRRASTHRIWCCYTNRWKYFSVHSNAYHQHHHRHHNIRCNNFARSSTVFPKRKKWKCLRTKIPSNSVSSVSRCECRSETWQNDKIYGNKNCEMEWQSHRNYVLDRLWFIHNGTESGVTTKRKCPKAHGIDWFHFFLCERKINIMIMRFVSGCSFRHKRSTTIPSTVHTIIVSSSDIIFDFQIYYRHASVAV